MKRCLALACLCLLAGCQGLPASSGDTSEPVAGEAPLRPIEADTLYALLGGEMALHREMYPLALGTYLQQAKATRDPGVAERAAEIAAALNAGAATVEAATLWSELEPDNPRAHFLAGIGLLQQHRPAEAFDHMVASQQGGGSTRFTGIAAEAEDPALRARLREHLERSLKDDPDNADWLMAHAMTAFTDGDNKAALKSVRRLLEQTPDDLRAVVFEARILLAMNEPEEALRRFKALLAEQPDNLRLQTEYARTLARVSPVEAQRQFSELSHKHPDQPELLLATALLAQENKDNATAEDSFRRLLLLGHYRNEAHYYLGMAALNRDDTASAITHLTAVTPGNAFIESRRTLVGIYLKENRLMEALHRLRTDQESLPDTPAYQDLLLELQLMEAEALLQRDLPKDSIIVLDRAIARHGDDNRLLYTRSLAREKLGDMAGAEADLRELLARDPGNATVLNALGYSLTVHTDRLDEALKLIEQAHRLEPNDPAITDSLGWVYFRMGNTRRALDYLQQAYAGMPDAEIGAHLGEALWLSGDQHGARAVWAECRQRQPEHAVLRETVERLTGQPLESLTP